MNEVYKPKTIKEAINNLHDFLECDLWSKFRPETIINRKKYYRTDVFESEEDFINYLNHHFKILQGEVKALMPSTEDKK